MKRDFESLSPREVLALAIHVERANTKRFQAFADVFRGYDEEVAERFEELAREERDHEGRLVEKFRKHFGGPIPTVEEEAVGGVIEAVDMDDPEHLIFDTLKPERVYELALLAERNARQFYLRAASGSPEDEIGELYRELADVEGDHEKWLEERLRQVRPPAGETP